MQPSGRVTAWFHNSDDTWTWMDQIKVSDNFDRANYRWGDVRNLSRLSVLPYRLTFLGERRRQIRPTYATGSLPTIHDL